MLQRDFSDTAGSSHLIRTSPTRSSIPLRPAFAAAGRFVACISGATATVSAALARRDIRGAGRGTGGWRGGVGSARRGRGNRGARRDGVRAGGSAGAGTAAAALRILSRRSGDVDLGLVVSRPDHWRRRRLLGAGGHGVV